MSACSGALVDVEPILSHVAAGVAPRRLGAIEPFVDDVLPGEG
jgi:hypothetical protein